MKRTSPASHAIGIGRALAAVFSVGLLLAGAPARADVDVRIDIGNAPPPPRIVFRARPHEMIYPGERVYVVDDPDLGDNDCFHYGGYYWVFREGYWYRSRGWRGRFVVVEPRRVPRYFYDLPAERWKHHPNRPPGLEKKGGMPPGQRKKAERGEDKHRDRDRH